MEDATVKRAQRTKFPKSWPDHDGGLCAMCCGFGGEPIAVIDLFINLSEAFVFIGILNDVGAAGFSKRECAR